MADNPTPQPRTLERRACDAGVNELGRLCDAMVRLRYRIGRFRAAHVNCPVRGRGRCRLCAELDTDFSGSDLWDVLGAVHSALAVFGNLLNHERPFAAVDARRRTARRTCAEGGDDDG